MLLREAPCFRRKDLDSFSSGGYLTALVRSRIRAGPSSSHSWKFQAVPGAGWDFPTLKDASKGGGVSECDREGCGGETRGSSTSWGALPWCPLSHGASGVKALRADRDVSSPSHPLSTCLLSISPSWCLSKPCYNESVSSFLLSGPRPAPNPGGPRNLTEDLPGERNRAAGLLLLCPCGEEQASFSKENVWPRRTNFLGKCLMVPLKCEFCASTKPMNCPCSVWGHRSCSGEYYIPPPHKQLYCFI